MKKKLVLKKEVIASLDNGAMNLLKGGLKTDVRIIKTDEKVACVKEKEPELVEVTFAGGCPTYVRGAYLCLM